MKLDLKWLLYLPIILYFFPAFALYIPFLGGVYQIFLLFLYTILILIFCFNFKYAVSRILTVYKTTPFKYFVWFCLGVSINSVILSIFGVTSIITTLSAIILRFILYIFPILLYGILIIDKYLDYVSFIKVFIVLLWLSLISGFIAYFGQWFDIALINNLYDFLANARSLRIGLSGLDAIRQASNYAAFGLPRLDNLSDEPSGYAQHLYLFLPFVYSFSSLKTPLFNNRFVNKLIKSTFIPFTWISIILTFSPIYLIFCILITIIYYFKEIIHYIKKYFVYVILAAFGGIALLSSIDLSETYLSRIINVVTEIRSFEDLIIIEPSLATRFVSYINTFCIFLKHPILGVGFKNVTSYLYQQYMFSPVVLTPEIMMNSTILLRTKGVPFLNENLIYTLLAENGILCCSILFYFAYKLKKYLKNIKNNTNVEEIYIAISHSLDLTFTALIIISFYNLHIMQINVYFILSMIIMFIYNYKKYFMGEFDDTKN